MERRLRLSGEGRLLFLGRALRASSFGWLSVTPAPFLLAGGLKIAYDLSLFFRFRGVPLLDASPSETRPHSRTA